MSGDAEDPLLSAAADISDGVPVDWNQLERGSSHGGPSGSHRGIAVARASCASDATAAGHVGTLRDRRGDRPRRVRYRLPRVRSDATD